MLTRIIKIITWGFFLLAVWIIAKEVRLVGGKNLIRLIADTPLWVTGIAGIGIILNYLILSGYDCLALEYIGKKLPYRRILKAAGIGFAFSNTTGHTYAAGGAIRYWFYMPLGISKTAILKMIVFETLTILIGIMVIFDIAILSAPPPGEEFYAVGFGVGILLALYIGCIVIPRKKIHIKALSLPAPSMKMTIKQIMVGVLDNGLLFLIFYTFLRYHLNAPFGETFSIFIIAQSIGFMVQVPGGLGVFESSFLYLFPHDNMQKSGILASLILFRIFYYFLPFILAMFYLGVQFIIRRKKLFSF